MNSPAITFDYELATKAKSDDESHKPTLFKQKINFIIWEGENSHKFKCYWQQNASEMKKEIRYGGTTIDINCMASGLNHKCMKKAQHKDFSSIKRRNIVIIKLYILLSHLKS